MAARIGVIFPHIGIERDPGAIRAYGQAAEGLGFRHLLVGDHVLGADRAAHPGYNRPLDVDTEFHEPFVLFGFLAAITTLELVTGVIILPQRQTALVAKQAAEVDVLTGGKLRLGIGVGWNKIEFEGLGLEFGNRGRRYDEQIELLRRYWTERAVTHKGEFETVTGAGIAPRPVQQPIPLWFGASSPAALRRAGRLGDGWFPQVDPGPELDAARAEVDRGAVEAGRDPATIGLEGRISFSGSPAPAPSSAASPGSSGDEDKLAREAAAWLKAGATHISVGTRSATGGVDGHIAALTRAAEVLGITPGRSA